MNPLYETGLQWVRILQNFGHPYLDAPMIFFSWLGEEWFYMLVIPIFLWSFHYRSGYRLYIFLLLSSYVNQLAKWFYHQPRPFWIDSGIKAIYPASSFGFPSGHAQNALGIWFLGALLLHRRFPEYRYFIVAGVMTLLISISRLYLGVHFPHDLFGGWMLALICILLYLLYEEKGQTLFRQQLLYQRIILSLLMILLLGLLASIVYGQMRSYRFSFPQVQLSTIRLADPRTMFSILGALAGALFGEALRREYCPRLTDTFTGSRVTRYAVGMAGLILIHLLLGQLEKLGLSADKPGTVMSPDSAGGPLLQVALYLRFLRYALLSLWAVFLLPLLFGSMEPEGYGQDYLLRRAFRSQKVQ